MKLQIDVMHDFLLADECTFNASIQSKIQESLDLFSAVRTKMTEVMHKPAPTVPYIEHTVTVGSVKLAVADKFTYLGSSLSRTVTINEKKLTTELHVQG